MWSVTCHKPSPISPAFDFAMSDIEMMDAAPLHEDPEASDEGEGDDLGADLRDSSEEEATDEEEEQNVKAGFIVDDDEEEPELSDDEERSHKKRRKRRRKGESPTWRAYFDS